MVTISAESLTRDYDAGIRMLAWQNYAQRNAQGEIIEKPSDAFFDKYIGEVNMDEVTQGYLRTECTLVTNTSTFTFPITEDQAGGLNPYTPTMQLLSKSDSFLVTALGYSLMSYQMTGGQQTNIDFTSGNSWLPLTFSDNWHNNGSAVSIDNGCDMFWIGASLNFKVQKKDLIPFWDCQKHLYVPTTQSATSQVPPFTLVKSGFVGNSSHYYPVARNICIGGMRTNVVTLKLPSNIPGTIPPFSIAGYNTTNVLKAVLDFQGLLLQNSTVAK